MKSFQQKSSAADSACAPSGATSRDESALSHEHKLRVGVQLYSVRARCAEDLIGTLKAIKDMGYSGVEFAGYYNRSARELKRILDDLGLVACGTHTGLDTIEPDQLQQTLEFAQELENEFLIVPAMLADTAERWIELAETFSLAAETARRAGIRVGYHNHQSEFIDKFDGRCPWDIFFSHAAPEVCQQLDVGHAVAAGEDPVYWLERFPMRSPTIHAKEVYPGSGVLGDVATGQRGVAWDAVFAAAAKDITEWYIVESEADPASLDNIRGCLEFLRLKGIA